MSWLSLQVYTKRSYITSGDWLNKPLMEPRVAENVKIVKMKALSAKDSARFSIFQWLFCQKDSQASMSYNQRHSHNKHLNAAWFCNLIKASLPEMSNRICKAITGALWFDGVYTLNILVRSIGLISSVLKCPEFSFWSHSNGILHH